jgi:hypothetical protein
VDRSLADSATSFPLFIGPILGEGYPTKPPDRLDGKKYTDSRSPKLYSKYLRMWRSDGWWWDVYGDDANFTMEDFITLVINYEAGYLATLKRGSFVVQSYAEALSRNAHQYCIYQNTISCDISTPESRLSWLAGWSSVAKRLVTGPANLWANPTSNAAFINNSIIDPSSAGHPEWATGKEPDRPYNAGNGTLNIEMAKHMANRGRLWYVSTSLKKDPNALIILTGCQDDYFHSTPHQYKYNC